MRLSAGLVQSEFAQSAIAGVGRNCAIDDVSTAFDSVALGRPFIFGQSLNWKKKEGKKRKEKKKKKKKKKTQLKYIGLVKVHWFVCSFPLPRSFLCHYCKHISLNVSDSP